MALDLRKKSQQEGSGQSVMSFTWENGNGSTQCIRMADVKTPQ